MTTIETQHTVDHMDLMRHDESRKRILGKKVARLALRFNPHGAGVFCAPSVADPIKAKRDPLTFKIDDQHVAIVECYEHEIPAIMAWVETDMEGCERASKAYIRNRKKFMATRLHPGTFIPDEPSQWNDEHRAAASAYNESAAASFSKEAGEREDGQPGRRFGIMPLLSCEVLETGIMPPKSGADMVNEQLAKISASGNAEMGASILALVDEMRQARGAPAADVGNAAAKKIAERDKKIAELEAKLAKSEKS